MKRFLCSLAAVVLLVLITGCAPEEYDVTVRLSDLTVEGGAVALEGEAFALTLKPHEGYWLPETVEVTVNGTVLTTSDFRYDCTTGVLHVPGELITGMVEIRAEGQLICYRVGVEPDSGLTLQGEAVAYPGKVYKGLLAPQEHFLLPESVSVSVSGTQLEESDFLYDAATGEIVIQTDMTGEILIGAQAEPVVHELNLEELQFVTVIAAEDAPVQPEEGIAPAYGFHGFLVPDPGYGFPYSAEVLVDGNTLDASGYAYDPKTGELTIHGASVTADVTVSAHAVAEICGIWQTTVDMSAYLSHHLHQSNPSMAQYCQFEGHMLTFTAYFTADGRCNIVLDKDSFGKVRDSLKEQMMDGVKQMLQEILDAQGLDMDVEEYLRITGDDTQDTVDALLNMSSLGLDGIGFTGGYCVNGTSLFVFEESGEPDGQKYSPYTLDADTLVLDILSSQAGSAGAYLYPLTWTRVTQ